MLSLLFGSQFAMANDVLILPFHVEGMVNMEWSPHLENSLMDQLSLNRIGYVSPNQMTREFGQRSFCVETTCLREMLFRPESDLILHGILDCKEECSLYLSVYDGISEVPAYQKLSKGSYGHIKRQMPIVVADIAQYLVKKYELEYTDQNIANTDTTKQKNSAHQIQDNPSPSR